MYHHQLSILSGGSEGEVHEEIRKRRRMIVIPLHNALGFERSLVKFGERQ